MTQRLVLTLLASLVVTPGALAQADTDQPEQVQVESPWKAPRHRLLYKNLTVARVNPLGFQDAFELAYQYRLFDSDSILLRDSFVGVATTAMVTPAFTRLGIAAQAQPLAILYLEAKWQFAGWYGTFDTLQTFGDVTADFSDTALEMGQGGATTGWELDLIAELRLKVGPLVVRSRLTFIRTEMTPPVTASDPLYYEPIYDLLVPTSGWSLTNDADALLFLLDERLIVGTRYSVGHVFYGADAAIVPTHRMGPLVAYRFFKDPGSSFDAPTALVLIQWYLRHPNRTGRDVSQAIPYVVVGFAFQGDLL